jgi:hypothetical protein
MDVHDFIPIFDGHYLAFRTGLEVSVILKNLNSDQNYVQVSMEQFDSECSTFCPSGLYDIYRFYSLARKISRREPGATVIFCAGHIEAVQIGSTFLLGCYLILSGKDSDEARSVFSDCDQLLKRFEYADCLQISDFWGAVHTAVVCSNFFPEHRRSPCSALAYFLYQEMGWLKFEAENGDEVSIGTIDIDEYAHYARSSIPAHSPAERGAAPGKRIAGGKKANATPARD